MPEFTVDWTTHHVGDWDRHLAHLKGKPAIGLEIGVYEGRSTEWFCRNVLDHHKSRLICVDLFSNKERYGTYLSNMIELDLLHKLDIRRQPSEQMMLPPNYLDFVYLDGWHSADAVMMDAMLCWRSLKSGGILCFDDYLWPGQIVKVP
jgi:predicted O-methyltransferase YrrM